MQFFKRDACVLVADLLEDLAETGVGHLFVEPCTEGIYSQMGKPLEGQAVNFERIDRLKPLLVGEALPVSPR